MNQQQIDELAAVMSMTSDRVIAAWHALRPIMLEAVQEIIKRANAFYRSLYAAGIIDTPVSNHPMTARKMRGAIRRLKAGEIGVSTES